MIHFNWQRSGLQPGAPYTRLSPNLLLVVVALRRGFGGTQNGGYTVRPVRGGTSWSDHAFGAAVDWRYGDDRAAGLQAARWLVDNHEALGVQVIHDYVGCRVWYCHRGWVDQTKGSHSGMMGTSWACWLHVGTNPDRWSDSRPLAERGSAAPAVAAAGGATSVSAGPRSDASGSPTAAAATSAAQNDKEATVAIINALPTLARGEKGRHVEIVQGILYGLGWNGTGEAERIDVDGTFGQQTERIVREFQALSGVTVDGKVGTTETWPALLSVGR